MANINAIKYLQLTPPRCSLHLSGGGLGGGFTRQGSGQQGEDNQNANSIPSALRTSAARCLCLAAHLLGSTHALAHISLLGNIRPASNNSFALSHPSLHPSTLSSPATAASPPLPGASPGGRGSKRAPRSSREGEGGRRLFLQTIPAISPNPFHGYGPQLGNIGCREPSAYKQ